MRLKGAVQAGSNFEYQSSSEGHESAIPFTFEYGIADRLELVVEPVARTRIRPNSGIQASGAGDTEVTLQYLLHREGKWPAFALGGEVKFPTAKSSLIGPGKTDYAGILIASKKLGNVDTHLNLSYTIVGQPAGHVPIQVRPPPAHREVIFATPKNPFRVETILCGTRNPCHTQSAWTPGSLLVCVSPKQSSFNPGPLGG